MEWTHRLKEIPAAEKTVGGERTMGEGQRHMLGQVCGGLVRETRQVMGRGDGFRLRCIEAGVLTLYHSRASMQTSDSAAYVVQKASRGVGALG